MHWKQWLMFAGIALVVLALDQASKALIVANLGLYEQWAPVPALDTVFTFTHTQNTGAAFSIFQNYVNVFIVIGFVTLGVIAYYYRVLASEGWPLRAALGLLLGGTLGNLVDRIRQGYVVDFLHVHGLPVFNVADIGIVGGVSLLLVFTWFLERRAVRQEDSEGQV